MGFLMSNLNERKVRYLKEGGGCRHQGAHLLVLGVDPPLQNKGGIGLHLLKGANCGSPRGKVQSKQDLFKQAASATKTPLLATLSV